MSVFELHENQSGKIVKIGADGKTAERLSALGFLVGAEVTLLGFSLFKSSVLIAVGQTRVAMRRSVARLVEVV